MAALTPALAAWAPRVLSVLRIVAALIFMAHGTQKLLGFPAGENPQPEFMTLFWIGGLIEVAAGVLLALGLFTRLAAFVASGEMAVAYWMFHHTAGNPFPANNGGDAAILYCFVFLYIAAAGPGPWSVDSRLHRSHR